MQTSQLKWNRQRHLPNGVLEGKTRKGFVGQGKVEEEEKEEVDFFYQFYLLAHFLVFVFLCTARAVLMISLSPPSLSLALTQWIDGEGRK